MLLDDVFEVNKEWAEIDKAKEEAGTKEYIKNINLDSVGEATKKAVKTDFGYTMALSTAGGIGLSIYFHSFYPLVFGLVAGIVIDLTLRGAEKANLISFK